MLKKEMQEFMKIIGYGTTCDAHTLLLHSGGVGGAEAIKLAIEDASLSLDKVDYKCSWNEYIS